MSDRRLVAALLLALLVTGLDASILNVLLPKLQVVFDTTMEKATLLGTVYVVLIAALGLPIGRLADILSPTKIFGTGIALFGLGSLGCVFSSSLWHMLAGRTVQGFGGAMLASSFGAVIIQGIDKEKTGSVIGQAVMVMSVGSLLGPPLGGWFASSLSWHWAFLINVPLCLIAFLLIAPYFSRKTQTEPLRLSRLDPAGSVLVGFFMICLPVGLHNLTSSDWKHPSVWVPLLIALICVPLFIRTEQTTQDPVAPPDLFFTGSVAILTLLKVTLFVALNGIMLVYPFFINSRTYLKLSDAGWLMLASALAMTIVTPIVGKVSDKLGAKKVMIFGSLFFMLSSAFSFYLGNSPSRLLLAVSLSLFGASVGALSVTSSVLFLKLAPPQHSGVFSAVNSLMAPVGGALGFSIFSLLYGSDEAGAVTDTGFQTSLFGVLTCAVIIFVGALISLRISPKNSDQKIG